MKALLLLAFGGPRSLDEVEVLLTRLFPNRKLSADQVERIKDRYRLIGGSSPLLDITSSQAEGLERELRDRGHVFRSYVGMRYCQPLIEETLAQIREDGLREIVALPMTPFESRASTGGYINEVQRVNEGLGGEFTVSFVTGWHCHPLFLQALRETIAQGLADFSPEERRRVHLVFTAHSLPKSMVANDPYVTQIEESVRALMEIIEERPRHLAFQSKGGGTDEWIGPDVDSLLEKLADEKVREVLIVPVGFVSDHIEILYDIDIVYRKKAAALGMVLKRSPSLNTSPAFLIALATVIEEHLKKS